MDADVTQCADDEHIDCLVLKAARTMPTGNICTSEFSGGAFFYSK